MYDKIFSLPGDFCSFRAFLTGRVSAAAREHTAAKEYLGEQYQEAAIPTFTLQQAILTALQRNPTLLNAEQEIKRTRGVIIQVRAQALPQINANANFQWTDPNLTGARILGNTTTTTGFTRASGPPHP